MRMCAHEKDKEPTNVLIDKKLKEAAKDEGLNLSKCLENALKVKLKDFSANAFSQKGLWCGGWDLNPRTPMGQRPQQNFLKKFYQKINFTKEDIELFLDSLRAANRSDRRISKLRRFLCRFGDAVNWKCSYQTVLDYLKERKKEISNRTLIDEIQMLKQFFKEFGGVRWLDKIKKPQIERKAPPMIRRDDILNYINLLSRVPVDHEKYFFRAKTAVILSSVSGLRPHEVYRLSWDDINLENRFIDLPAKKTKTKHARKVIFNNEAKEHLKKLKDRFPTRPFYRKVIYALTKKLDPKPDFKFKYCRKFFSQTWDRKNMPTPIKKILLGRFGSVDVRNYNYQSVSDLRKIYDRAGLEILD